MRVNRAEGLAKAARVAIASLDPAEEKLTRAQRDLAIKEEVKVRVKAEAKVGAKVAAEVRAAGEGAKAQATEKGVEAPVTGNGAEARVIGKRAAGPQAEAKGAQGQAALPREAHSISPNTILKKTSNLMLK